MTQKWIGISILAVQIVTALGVPMAVAPWWRFERARASRTERFPCETCRCGCESAEQCWSNCCCHTPAERLAWAKKNGIEPPAFVRYLVQVETECSSECECTEESARSRHKLPDETDKSCCSGGPARCEHAAAIVAHSTTPVPTDSQSVIILKALACRGLVVHFLCPDPGLVDRTRHLPQEEASRWLMPVAEPFYCGVAAEPSVPPPRA